MAKKGNTAKNITKYPNKEAMTLPTLVGFFCITGPFAIDNKSPRNTFK